jgi:Domain of unknown function (DUF4386)
MSPTTPASIDQGITLRQAALTAGFGILILAFAAPFAEFYLYPQVVVTGDIEATVQNIKAKEGVFLGAFICYLITALGDLLVAWALYVLLAPTNRSAALLAAWFRLIYTAIFIVAFLKLATVFRLLNTPDNMTVLGPDQLHVQVELLLRSFRYEWSFGLVFFGAHLVLVGYLVYRSGYIPKILGLLLVIAGVGNSVQALSPYLYPNADLGFIMITFFGELIFMLWLLVGGWRIKEPTA